MGTNAVAIPPGEFLKEELEARGWSQVEFAEILGVSTRLVSEILSAKRAITPPTAQAIAAAFGTSAQVWLNLESAYQLAKTPRDDSKVSRRARVYALAPVKEMIRRQWIKGSGDIEELEAQVLSFLDIPGLDKEPVFLPHAARASAPFNAAQRAWLFRARALARAMPLTAKFSDARWTEAVTRLKALCHAPQEARHVVKVLGDAGIRFLVLEHLPQTRIDGVCFWLDERSPVVALSMRYDRIDSFWHTLMHELIHVKERHGLKEQPRLDIDVLQQTDAQEKAVNAAAANALIAHSEIENFMARVGPLYSKDKIRGFATRVGVHPGIVVGQLHHRIQIWTHSREMLVPIRQYVVGSALTDGWGHVVATRV